MSQEQIAGEVVHFHLNDQVVWNEDRLISEMVTPMKEKYGEGPFQVVQVRLHTTEFRECMPHAHPEAVTIEIRNENRREFSGDWFKKA